MKNSIKRMICLIFTAILTLSCTVVPMTAFAHEKTGSITIRYTDEGTKIEGDKYIEEEIFIDGATFSAVLVAKEENGRFEWIEQIKNDKTFNYTTEDMLDETQIEVVSKELVDKFGRKLNVFTKTTTKLGKCVFSDLEKGIYLVWESDKEGTAKMYEYSVPFLVEIPNRECDPFDFDVEVYPKSAKLTVRMVTVTGTKNWVGNDIVGKEDNSNNKTKTDNDKEKVYRPDYITLRLYADGKEVGKTTTNLAKNWVFSFDPVNALNENGEEVTFTIKEDPIKGYIFTQSAPKIGENTIVINVTNTVGEEAAQTGDESNLWLWLGILGTCVILAGVILIVPYKKKKNEGRN